MPLWAQPVLRSLQEALESDGLIRTLDSGTVTVLKAAEGAGTVKKNVPIISRVVRGTKYDAS